MVEAQGIGDMKGDDVDLYDEIPSAQDCRWHRQLKAHSATYAYMGETCALTGSCARARICILTRKA